jgi:hypothetical protein
MTAEDSFVMKLKSDLKQYATIADFNAASASQTPKMGGIKLKK